MYCGAALPCASMVLAPFQSTVIDFETFFGASGCTP